MFDVWMGDVSLTVIVITISVIIVLPLQLFLCFKVKNQLLRLLPALLLLIAGIVMMALASSAEGWEGLGYIILALYCTFMLLACGIAWLGWAIMYCVRKNKKEH